MDLKNFLEMVAGPTLNVHIRSESTLDGDIEEYWIDPKKYDNDSLQAAFTQKSLEEHRNMWFQVGAVEPGKKQPIEANFIWADIDIYKYPGGETQALGLMRYLPQPSVMVRSGRGIHIYWKLTHPIQASGPMSPAQLLAKSAQWMLGSDAAHNPTKLLRVLGTYNFKPSEYEGGKECVLISENDLTYDPATFPMDETLIKIGHKLMLKVMLGPDSPAVDRSEYDFHIVAELLKSGFTPQEVSHIMRTYPCSGKVGSDPSHAEHYIKKTIESAMMRVSLNPTFKMVKANAAAWTGKSLADILKEEKPEFIIDEFLPNKGIAMVAAPPKARKSWCVMQMAEAVANGGEWLGFKVPKGRKVLYVQAELPNWIIAERIIQMYGANPMENVMFYHVAGANLLEDEDLQGLLDAVREHDAELVIIDPVANFWQGDENSSSSVNKLFDQLTKIQNMGAAVVMVHHSRKTEVNERLSPQHQRGSNVFFARPDAVVTLSPMIYPGELPTTYADFALRAAAPVEAMKLYVDETGKFTVNAPTLGSNVSPVRQRMIEMIRSKNKENDDTLPWDNTPVMTYGGN